MARVGRAPPPRGHALRATTRRRRCRRAGATRCASSPGAGGTRWEQWDFARALRASRPDVLFAPGYTAPLACPAPVALAVHDVSFFAHPEWYPAARASADARSRPGRRGAPGSCWRRRRSRRARSCATSASTPPGFAWSTSASARRREPSGESRDPVVLFVGSLFQRRRVDVLIDAFAVVARTRPGARLEIVGENRTTPRVDFAAAIAARGLEGARAPAALGRRRHPRRLVSPRHRLRVSLASTKASASPRSRRMARGAVPLVLDTPVAREILRRGRPAAWPTRPVSSPTWRPRCVAARRSGGPRALSPRRRPVLASYRWADAAARTLAHVEEAAGA